MKSKEEIEKIEADYKASGTRHNIVTVFLEEDNTDETATFFLKKPDKTVRQLIDKLVGEKKSLQAVYACIKNLHIAGDDPAILQINDYALASAEDACVRLLEVQKAELKKN